MEVTNLFTVVIAEKYFTDGIEKYRQFLDPFIKTNNVAFCEWNKSGESLQEMIPELMNSIIRHKQWRAIILCGDDGADRKNPFDLSGYVPVDKKNYDTEEAYLLETRDAMYDALDRASKLPLTRLVTWLCNPPLDPLKNAADEEDTEYDSRSLYQDIASKKAELRAQIKQIPLEQQFELPVDVQCIAMRNCATEQYDVDSAWGSHTEMEYSHFYNWNMYYDRMRYLVYDILPANHKDYEFDFIRYIYTVLVVANRELPNACLSANRVYRLICETDADELRRFLIAYESKLAATAGMISEKLQELKSRPIVHLTDEEAMDIFCSDARIPVVLDSDMTKDDLKANTGGVGLASDVPADEMKKWNDDIKRIKKNITHLVKMPERALKRAGADMRLIGAAPEFKKAAGLTEYQLEDLREHIDKEEIAMIDTVKEGIHSREYYNKKIDEARKDVESFMKTRMKRKTIIGVTSVALLVFLAGFLPMIFANINNVLTVVTSLVFSAIGITVIAIAGFICLFVYKRKMRRKLVNFNGEMESISRELDMATHSYSDYLTHMCNVMRGFAISDYCDNRRDPNATLVSIYNKHLVALMNERALLNEIYGRFLDGSKLDMESADPYQYDFTKNVDYTYPMPFSKSMERTIPFMQVGVTTTVPVSYITEIRVRREELYD